MPLVGAQGPGSLISWRGNLDEYPNSFIFNDSLDVNAGVAVTSNTQTITGINNKALVTAVGSACSISVNDGPFLDGNDSNNPIVIENNDTITLRLFTQDTGSQFDFLKSYIVNVAVGKRTANWLVRTKAIDDDPVPFLFDDDLNNEIGIAKTSNEVQVTDIDNVVGVDALIGSATGTIYVNGVDSGTSAKIFDGDLVYVENTSSQFYDTTVTTILTIGTYTTEFDIKTRVANKTVDSFSFSPVSNVSLSTQNVSNTITITGPDPNVNGNNPIPASINGGEFKVVRNGVEVRGYSSNPFNVQTNDQITVRLTASSSYSTTSTATLTVNQTVGTYQVTTRPAPVKTFPSSFSFTDLTNTARASLITSSPITLSGMSTGESDFGTATVSSPGEFKVERNGVVVRDFSSSSAQVKNGDLIYLRVLSSANSLSTTSITFTVSGIDTADFFNQVNGSTSDIWNITTAQRSCNITTFSFAEELNATPGETYVRSFVASGFDTDCGCSVTVSNTSNSYLKIGNTTGTNLPVSLGQTVEVYMLSPYYDTTRTTTVTLSSSYGTTKSAIFKITPKAPPLPTLTLNANPRNSEFVFPVGGASTISYSYDFVTNPSVTTNFGVTTVQTPTGTASSSITNILTNTVYNMTVSNSTGSVTKSVEVTVGSPPTPVITLCPSDTSSCSSISNLQYGSDVTLYWKTQYATTTSSPDFETDNLQNGSVTIQNLTTDNTTFTITASNSGGSVSTTHTVNLTPAVSLTASSEDIVSGQSTVLTWSSFLATEVVSSSGFNANGQVNGSVTVSPNSTTTYSITVRDSEGNQITDTIRVNVTEDRTVTSFSFSPSSFTNRNLGESVSATPVFSDGGSSVSGLSPNVTVTALALNGSYFSKSGTNLVTSKQVTNGTPATDLTLFIDNSSSFNTQRTATLDINGVTGSYTTRTIECVVNNSSGTIDNQITILLRDAQGYVDPLAYGLTGGSSIITRTNQIVEETYSNGFNDGTYTVTLPSGVTSLYGAVIGGGGGGGAGAQQCYFQNSSTAVGSGGGGAGSGWGTFSGSLGGATVTIITGRGGSPSTGGPASGGSGGTSSIAINGTVRWRGSGGGGGTSSGTGIGGVGGTNNLGPAGSANGASGNGSIRGGGGGGGSGLINGGTGANGANGCFQSGSSGYQGGGTGGTGGLLTGGSTPGAAGRCTTTDKCRNLGGGGGSYGGGGGGSAGDAFGGFGAPGGAYIRYETNYPQVSYFTLCTEIMRAHWDGYNRPPTIAQIQSWVNNFKNNPATYPSETSVYNAIITQASGQFGTAPVDNCGGAFTKYP